MDVEISISLSLLINKLQDLTGDERLKKEIQTAITNLHSLNQFLKDLEASSSGGSANDPRASQLLKAVYSAEDATDTFLMRKEIQLFEEIRSAERKEIIELRKERNEEMEKWNEEWNSIFIESKAQKIMKLFFRHTRELASYPIHWIGKSKEYSMSYTQKMKQVCNSIRFVQKMEKFNDEVRRLVEIKGAETSDVENSNNKRLSRFHNDRDNLRQRQHWERISDFCLEDATHVVSLQQQINELVVRLIPQPIRNDGQSGGNEIQVLDDQQHRVESTEVIAVVGEGGSGKTTLARSVYNRIDVKRHFTIRAWVRIPSVFKARDVLADILKQINQYESADETLTEYGLMLKLTKHLKGKRFLIVLDDVDQMQQVWESLVSSLISFSSHEGSKIIIIVRSTDSLPENDFSTLKICKLKNEESWKLFSNKVRIAEDELNNSELITLKEKEQILNICGGLPSTIVLLGGLLSTKRCDEWSRVLTNKSTSEDILALSYQDLPSEVKPCFLHMGLFPKRFEIPVRRLIHLWCAERFVATPVPEEIDPEDVAEMCLEELVTRNMVQVRWTLDGSPKTCCMPNVLYDFYSSEAANVGFLYQSSQTLPRQQEVSFRRLAANVEMDYLPSSLSCVQNTRSYVAFDSRVPVTPAMGIYEFLRRLTGKRGFGLLRVLDVEGVFRPFLSSDQIGRLFLLTYLSLRSTSIDYLPEWVGHMPYLETLDVKHTNITHISLSGANKLRHLYLNPVIGYFDFFRLQDSFWLPDSTNLRTLKGLNYYQSRMTHIFRMTRLTKLGLLSYRSLEDGAGINQLTELQSLKCKVINRGEVNSIDVLSLAGHHRLQELYLLAKLPQSVIKVGFLPPNLRKLTLSLSELQEDPMAVLGELNHLNILRFLSRSYMGEEMACLSKGFPKLHLLKLWDLPVLRVWTVEEGAMPCLRELEIRKCESLELPQQGLQNVTALKELVLTNMPKDFGADVEKSLRGRNVNITNNSWKSDPFPERTTKNPRWDAL